MKKTAILIIIFLIFSLYACFGDEISGEPADLHILPLGWGVELFMYYPYTSFTTGDFGSSSFGIAASYNALVESFWISVNLSGMLGSVFNMDLNVEAHYLIGDPGWFAAPYPLAGVGFGIGGPFGEGNPIYIQLLVGGGLLLLRNFTFQVHITVIYSFPIVEAVRFDSLSGLRFGIGIIYYVDVE